MIVTILHLERSDEEDYGEVSRVNTHIVCEVLRELKWRAGGHKLV